MKKLSLNRETVRNLDLATLKNLQGGGRKPFTKGKCIITLTSCYACTCATAQCVPETDIC